LRAVAERKAILDNIPATDGLFGGSVTYWDVFRSLLSQMDHEDSLLLARTGWLVFTELLLLIAYVCIDKKKLPADPPVNHHRMLSVFGVVSTIFILSAILAAIKLFVELRTSMFMLMAEHPDLPMRKLDRNGIGTGLSCPILLSLAFLFLWSRLAFSSRWAAVLMTASALLLSLFVIVLAHELRPGPLRSVLLASSGTIGIAFLVTGIWSGARSVRASPST
jgi:hypothetical protein